MNSEVAAPIKWIRENQDKLVEFIQKIVRVPSVSGMELDAQKLIYKKLEELNLQPKYAYPDVDILKKNKDYFETTSFVKYGYENRPNVMSMLKGEGNGRSICLSGHIDVVSPEPVSQWTHGPWSGDIEGDFIYGRGSADMKAGVAAIIFAVQALIETKTIVKGDIFIESTIDEEDGGIGGNLFMRLAGKQKIDAAIITEPAGLTIGVASAGVMYFRVIVEGVPAHAGTAHYGVNAIVKMASIIEALKTLNEKRQGRISYKYAELYPPDKGKATTLNIGTIKAGDWPSTVPAICTLECRIGFPPGETREIVMKEVEKTITETSKNDPWLKEHPPKIEWFGWKARPHEQNPEHPFVSLISNKMEQLTGEKPPKVGGSTGLDARFFVHNGIPAVTFGPYGEKVHSSDERVSISSTVKTIEVLIGVVCDWCGVSDRN
jgi:acetylornithine deacetylase